ncbi:MAG TPA: septal ring lytic transglycosylase RlpA family protein [Geothermobacteraceae bacterium]|nr:septal ring lytic transglycosylase RlpA family protein [Geothermobacteraceae bacterium]
MTLRLVAFSVLVTLLMLTACGRPAYRTQVVDTPETRELKGYQKPYIVNGKLYSPLRDHAGFVQEGIASWYGRDFHGKLTSNGETYDMYALTAAHKTLPMGVHVRVTNKSNGRQLVVRVNDRGPFVAGRIIDLSYTAAKRLGVVGPGTAPVRIEALGYQASDSVGKITYRQPESYQVGSFTIQVGAFSVAENAQRLSAKLRRSHGASSIQQGWVNGQLFYRVRAGQYASLEAAEQARKDFVRLGYNHPFVIAME